MIITKFIIIGLINLFKTHLIIKKQKQMKIDKERLNLRIYLDLVLEFHKNSIFFKGSFLVLDL